MNVLDELLKEACRNGNLKDVSSLLRVGANINCENGLPLMLAVYNNHTELAEYLLQADADGSVAYIAAILQQNGGHARILTEYKQNPCKDPYLRQLAFQLTQIATDDTGYDWNELFKKLQKHLETKFENTDRKNWVPPMPIHVKQKSENEEKMDESKRKRSFLRFFTAFPFPLKRLKDSEEKLITMENNQEQPEKTEKVENQVHVPLPKEILQEKSCPDYGKGKENDSDDNQVPKVDLKQEMTNRQPVKRVKPVAKPIKSLENIELLGKGKPIENKVIDRENRKRESDDVIPQVRTKTRSSDDLLLEAAKKGEIESIKILLQLVEADEIIYRAFKSSIENNFFSSATVLLDANPDILHFNNDEIYKSMMELENERVIKYLRKKDPYYAWPESKSQIPIQKRKAVKKEKINNMPQKEIYFTETYEKDIYADINYAELIEEKTDNVQDKIFHQLMDSIYAKNMKQLSFLATKISSQETWNQLALWAVENCEEKEILEFIWQYVDIHDGDEALLAAAASYRNYAAAETLLEAGANANARAGMIMILAARNKDAEMVRILSEDGFPALEATLTFAINNHNQTIIETIRKAEVDVSFYLSELEKLAREKGCPRILNSLRKEK